MAGAGFKTFASGEVLTATNVNTYLMEQSIMVFADSSARDTAIASPSEGMFVYLTGTDELQFYNGSAWIPFSAGAKGGGTDQVFYENDQTVTTNYTLTSGTNAVTAGPVTINSGVTVTVPSGSVWTVV